MHEMIGNPEGFTSDPEQPAASVIVKESDASEASFIPSQQHWAAT
jgi:hypothetical protein